MACPEPAVERTRRLRALRGGGRQEGPRGLVDMLGYNANYNVPDLTILPDPDEQVPRRGCGERER